MKLVVVVLLLLIMCTSSDGTSKQCLMWPSSCGSISNISYPFGVRGDCRSGSNNDGVVEVSCDSNNNRTILFVDHMKFYVQDIDPYSRYAADMWLVDASVVDSNDSCFIPSLSRCFSSYSQSCGLWDAYNPTNNGIALVNCSKPLNSSSVSLHSNNIYPVDTSSCSSPNHHNYYFYVANATYFETSLLDESCVVQATIPYPQYYPLIFPIPSIDQTLSNNTTISFLNIHQWLLNGFQASFSIYQEDYCYLRWRNLNWNFIWNHIWTKTFFVSALQATGRYTYRIITLQYWINAASYDDWEVPVFGTITGLLPARTLLGILCLIAIILHKWRKRHLSVDDAIEEFLQSQNNLMPINYSYREIKNITRGFNHKLGQGGFGSVFKGKL